MMNFLEINMNLKLTWIRKILNSYADWIEFANYYKVERLITTDVTYHDKMIHHIDNPFWKSVAISYKTWFLKFMN